MKIHTRTVIDLHSGEILEDEWYEYEGDVVEAKGGGDETTTVAEPPAFQIPYINTVLSEALKQYQSPGPQYYPGPTVAPFQPAQVSGQNLALGAAGQQAGAANAAGNALQFQLGPAANPLTNPFFMSTVEGITAPAYRDFTQQVLPQIDQGALLAGQYGGARHGVVQNQALDIFGRSLGEQLSQFGNQAYQQGLQTQTQALALAPSIGQQFLQPAQTFIDVGNLQQQQAQAELSGDIERHNYEETLRQQMLQQFAGLVGNPLGSSTTQITPGPNSSAFASGAGGALSGGVLGYALAGSQAGGLSGPQGALIGAGLGALYGIFGS